MSSDELKEKPSSEDDGKVNGKAPEATPAAKPAAKKDGILKKTWDAVKPPIILLMIKGALPPILALAAYRSQAFADQYTTLGYLIGIMSLLTLAFQPRAKFIQSIFFSVLFTCLGAAFALLVIQCCVAARNLSKPPAGSARGTSGSQEAVAYSSSANAVAACWLFFAIYVINLLKAYRPALMIVTIQFSIFAIISCVYAPRFPTMDAGKGFVRRLLITFLTGFAFGTGVNLCIFPMTSRMVISKQIAGMCGLLKASIMAQGAYMQAVGEAKDPSEEKAKAGALKATRTALGGLFSKIKLEEPFAKKELGYGKMGAEEYSDVTRLLQHILLPVMGLTTFIDIVDSVKQRTERYKDGSGIDSEDFLKTIRAMEAEEAHEIMELSRPEYIRLKASLAGGIDHFTYVLGVAKNPKPKKGDVEKAAGEGPQPGANDYVAKVLKPAIESFHEHRQTALIRWAQRKGVDLPQAYHEDPHFMKNLKEHVITQDHRKAHNQQQLYLMLYIEFLMHNVGTSILKAAEYADAKFADGTLAKSRFISPGWRRIQKLFADAISNKDSVNDISDGDDTATAVFVGDSLKASKDPEHLPPANVWQRFTNGFRSISTLLASPQSHFAFRCATATISIGLIAYLRETQNFFFVQRGTWALIMVAISMDPSSGRGVFGFVFRILGTAIAMVFSIIIWYIGYKHAAAILPIFYIYLMCCLLFLLKKPQFAVVAIISMVTVILIVGYELQDQVIGRKLTLSNGQPFYKIYVLAPYRLATVCIGLAAAFIWTYFPYPVTTHSTLRKDLGNTLYLLANHYSCTHTTITTRLKYGDISSEEVKGTPLFKLAKARRKVFGKMIAMLSKLREHSSFTKWEIQFGGKFPKETYDELIDKVQHVFNYTSLMAFSSAAFCADSNREGDDGSEWLRDFRGFIQDVKPTSHDITSSLCLLSSSLVDSRPLPPYLRGLRTYDLGKRMEEVDPEILSVKHVNEPCYAAFAVLEVASSLITDEMDKIADLIRKLVGEVDFSFHVHTVQEGRDSESSTLVPDKYKGKSD